MDTIQLVTRLITAEKKKEQLHLAFSKSSSVCPSDQRVEQRIAAAHQSGRLALQKVLKALKDGAEPSGPAFTLQDPAEQAKFLKAFTHKVGSGEVFSTNDEPIPSLRS